MFKYPHVRFCPPPAHPPPPSPPPLTPPPALSRLPMAYCSPLLCTQSSQRLGATPSQCRLDSPCPLIRPVHPASKLPRGTRPARSACEGPPKTERARRAARSDWYIVACPRAAVPFDNMEQIREYPPYYTQVEPPVAGTLCRAARARASRRAAFKLAWFVLFRHASSETRNSRRRRRRRGQAMVLLAYELKRIAKTFRSCTGSPLWLKVGPAAIQ